MPKTITSSVGRGGRNFPPVDVMTVQYLLNCVPMQHGGANPELVVDGAVGPKTIAAIEKFQRGNVGACDGRVDASVPDSFRQLAAQSADSCARQCPVVRHSCDGYGSDPQSDLHNAGTSL